MPPKNGHVGETDEILSVAAYIVVDPPGTEVTHIRIRIQRLSLLSRRRHTAVSESSTLEAEIH